MRNASLEVYLQTLAEFKFEANPTLFRLIKLYIPNEVTVPTKISQRTTIQRTQRRILRQNLRVMIFLPGIN